MTPLRLRDDAPPATHSALLVAVPEAERVVGEHRARFDLAAAWGVPAHVTVLFPFAPPEAAEDATVVAAVASAVSSVPAFGCTFASTGWFDRDVLWLAPDPTGPFVALTRALWEAFPTFPPYEGLYREIHPHLTVAQRAAGADDAALLSAESSVTASLPVSTQVTEVLWITGTQSPDSWRTAHHFPLG